MVAGGGERQVDTEESFANTRSGRRCSTNCSALPLFIMNLKPLLFALLFTNATAVFSADPAPMTLRGVLTMSDGYQFALVSEDASRTKWAKLGSEFDGYVLKSYDAPSETLTLERAGKVFTAVLSDGRFTGTTAPLGTKATLADAEVVVNQMQIEKLLEKSLEGQRRIMSRGIEQAAAQSGGKAAPEDIAAHQKAVMDVITAAINPEQMKKDMAQIYSETFTKEELSAVAAFHQTPAGKTMIERQPAIQQRMQELMMPRMAEAMPKIKQMNADFIKEQKAKVAAAAGANKPDPAPADNTPAAK
jgi:hypothetical protein